MFSVVFLGLDLYFLNGLMYGGYCKNKTQKKTLEYVFYILEHERRRNDTLSRAKKAAQEI